MMKHLTTTTMVLMMKRVLKKSDDEENDDGESQHVEDLYYNPRSQTWKHSDEEN